MLCGQFLILWKWTHNGKWKHTNCCQLSCNPHKQMKQISIWWVFRQLFRYGFDVHQRRKITKLVFKMWWQVNRLIIPKKITPDHQYGHDINRITDHVKHKKRHWNCLEVLEGNIPIAFFQQCHIGPLLNGKVTHPTKTENLNRLRPSYISICPC